MLAVPGVAAADGTIRGALPRIGGAVVVWSGGPVADFVASAAVAGCAARTLWYLRSADGSAADRAAFYIPGAPDRVNADWHARIGDPLPAGPLYVQCAAPPAAPSVLASNQVVSLYGYPGIPSMGALGAHDVNGAADEAERRAAQHDTLNGTRGAIAAFQPIAIVAHPVPGAAGDYVGRMSPDVLQPYIDVARARGMLVILDLQLGWADPVTELRRLMPFLVEPFVHVAIDPEYMTRAKGEAPGSAIGGVTAATVDAVQAYLAQLVRTRGLPPKLLVVHQFREDMVEVPAGGRFTDHPEVDVVIDMDGFGPHLGKLSKYRLFALSSYAERAGLKLFLTYDTPLLSPAEVEALETPPGLVIYQ